MKRNKHKSACADNARHGRSLMRTMMNVARKVVRSLAWIVRGVLKGLLRAVKVWTDSAPARGY